MNGCFYSEMIQMIDGYQWIRQGAECSNLTGYSMLRAVKEVLVVKGWLNWSYIQLTKLTWENVICPLQNAEDGPQSIFRTVSYVCWHCEAMRTYSSPHIVLDWVHSAPSYEMGGEGEFSFIYIYIPIPFFPKRLQDLHWRRVGSSGWRNPTRLSVHHLPWDSRRGLRPLKAWRFWFTSLHDMPRTGRS